MYKDPDIARALQNVFATEPLHAVLVDVHSGRALSAVADVPRSGIIRLPVLASSDEARVDVSTTDGTPVAWFAVSTPVVVTDIVTMDLNRVAFTYA